MRDDHEVETIEVRLFLEAVHERYGYDLRQYSDASMRRRISSVLAHSGLAHLGELQHRVLTDSGFFASVLDGLTVHVSAMFRDPPFYQTMRQRLLPILHTYPFLKIWHCGCATGEEVYATAILLTEAGLYDRAQIHATDLSPHALEQARQGVYSLEKLEAFDENYRLGGGRGSLTGYCTSAYGGMAMAASLRRNISFFQHDLVTDQVFGEMHVVICRNVLIYFARELKQRMMAKLAESLCPGGFLCLGSSEVVADAQAHSLESFDADARIYRHAGG